MLGLAVGLEFIADVGTYAQQGSLNCHPTNLKCILNFRDISGRPGRLKHGQLEGELARYPQV